MSLSEREHHASRRWNGPWWPTTRIFAANTSIDRLQQLRRRWVIIPGEMFVLGMILLVAGLVTTHALRAMGVAISVGGVLTTATAAVVFLRRHRR